MRIRHLRLGAALSAALVILGCGTSSTSSDPALGGGPKEVTEAFLEAVRVGDDKKAETLLTPITRQKMAEHETAVAPPGSETAKYAVRDVMMVDGGAHVATDWTDVDADGQMHTDRIVWILRQEPEGWRIAGMATKVFDDRPPVVLNFEDPAEMMRQQKWVGEEMARREGSQTPSASAAPEKKMR
ncbi:MAG: hypothetical protein AB7O59_23885 [Pirellulales bacterium]